MNKKMEKNHHLSLYTLSVFWVLGVLRCVGIEVCLLKNKSPTQWVELMFRKECRSTDRHGMHGQSYGMEYQSKY